MQGLTATAPSVGDRSREAARSSAPGNKTDIRLRCPNCDAVLGSGSYDSLATAGHEFRCADCTRTLKQDRGIWEALRADRRQHFERFVREYQIVREKEGRGSHDPEYYLALPSCDKRDRNAWQWNIRSKTFAFVRDSILPTLAKQSAGPLRLLDLGAGNGWLSYRLAELRHRPVAVDLLVNAADGLAAACHYQLALPQFFPRFQAEMDRLPFADSQFDGCIFNASFHYSENYGRTIAEAIRCLRPGGMIVVADTPWYRNDENGRRMIAERRDHFLAKFGFASDGLASEEYLTDEKLAALASEHGLQWQIHKPWYGMRWAMRPYVSRWKGERESSEFRVYSAQVQKS